MVTDTDAPSSPPRLVDLSHVVTEGLQTYPGLPAPHLFTHLDRDAAELVYGEGSRSPSG